MHRHIPGQPGVTALHFDQHTDAIAVQVTGQDAAGHFATDKAANIDILTDRGNQATAGFFYCSTTILQRQSQQGIYVGRCILEDAPGNGAGELLKLGLAGDEVGFRINFQHNGVLAVTADLDHDHAFSRDPTGFLVGLGQT